MEGGRPGSMSAYARAERGCFMVSDGPGPSDYDIKNSGITVKDEIDPPFHTTAVRSDNYETPGNGPIYYPFKRDLREHGSPLFRWRSRFPPEKGPDCTEGDMGRIPDPWVQMTQQIKDMEAKRPRVPFEKSVSNCCPTVFHPRDVRCFIQGIDGRIYPWSLERGGRIPGPIYDTYQVYTSASKRPAPINFGAVSARKDLFPPIPGFGPADFVIQSQDTQCGGEFLGKSSTDPDSSGPRLFDILERRNINDPIPCPSATLIPSQFEWYSPRAVSAPFKSKTKVSEKVAQLGLPLPQSGPGPSDYFVQKLDETDVKIKIEPGVITFPPEKAPFDTTQERFQDPETTENESRPSPNAYTIPGFAEELQRDVIKHAAAIPNPKLGFLTSACARPCPKFKTEEVEVCRREADRKWRNMRPPRGVTYSYFGPPPKYPDSPGPIYDTRPGYAAVKNQKSWLDPRHTSRTGFLNSGTTRTTQCYTIDKNIPGPGIYYSVLPCCRTERFGKTSKHGPRFTEKLADGPGPVHKLHEKCESMWRASHLGTFNADLKGLGVVYPWAGGFIKKNLNIAADKMLMINRPDDYANVLCTADTSLLQKC